MGNLSVQKPGKTKQQLLVCLEQIKDKFKGDIADNNVELKKTSDGYDISAEKKILFMTFWVKSKILAEDGKFLLTWETNAPESKVDEAMDKVKKILEEC
jgi:hypothetical protein